MSSAGSSHTLQQAQYKWLEGLEKEDQKAYFPGLINSLIIGRLFLCYHATCETKYDFENLEGQPISYQHRSFSDMFSSLGGALLVTSYISVAVWIVN